MLQLICKSIWQEPDANESLSRAQTISQLVANTHNILIILLRIPSISVSAAIKCIDAISRGYIVGKLAWQCISEINLFIISMKQESKNSLLLFMSNEEILLSLMKIASAIITPFQNSSDNNLPSSTSLLDVLPVCISVLISLPEAQENCVPTTEPAYLTILDSLCFNTQWRSDNIIPLFNCLCDLYSHLTPTHISELKVSYNCHIVIHFLFICTFYYRECCYELLIYLERSRVTSLVCSGYASV